MKKKRYMALSAAVIACLLGSGLAMKPLAEHYAAPLVQEQLNKSINGHVAYDSLSIAWDGSIDIRNVSIVDVDGHAVGQADQVAVGLSLLEAPKLLTGGSAAQLISDVTVSDGNLHLWQDADQEWNVSHLIVSDDSQEQVTFKGDVHFKNMDVTARPYGQEAYQVEAVTGGVSLSDMPRISGSATGLLDGQELAVTGSMDTDNISDFRAYIKADRLDAKYANSFLAGHKDISLQGGYAKNIRLNVVGDGSGSIDLTGYAALREVAGAYGFNGQTFDFANAEANLAFTDNKILIQRGSADVNGQHGQVSGFVALGQDAADLSLDIVATDVDASALLPEPVEGTWAASIHVGGDSLAPTVSGTVLGQDIAYQGYSVDTLKGNIDYRDNRLSITDLAVAKGNSSLEGALTYHTDSQDFDLVANPNQVQIGDFKDLLGYDVDGYLSGHIYAHGSGGQLTALTGTLEGQSVSYQGITLDSLSMGLASDGDNIEVSYLNGQVGEGTFTGYGSLTNGQAHISLSGNQIPLSALSSYAGHSLEGQATVLAQIQGNLDDMTGQVQVTTGPLSIDGISHFDSLTLDGSIEGQVVTIDQALLMDKSGHYAASGRFDLRDKSMDINAEAKEVRAENVLPLATDFPVTGWFSTQNHITGTLDAPMVEGRARLRDGSIKGFLITDMYTRYRYNGDTLQVNDATINAYGSSIMGQGTMVGRDLDFSFTGDGIALKPLVPSDSSLQVDGYVAASGTITGSVDNPVFQGDVRSRKVVVNGSSFSNIEGSLYADKQAVNVLNLSLHDEDGGIYSFKGGVDMAEGNRLFGQANVEKANIENIIEIATDKEVDNVVNGQLDGTIGLGGTADNPSLDVMGFITDVSFGDQIVGTATIDASLSNKKWNIRKLALPIDTGTIAVGGTMDYNQNGDADLQVAVNSVDVKYFNSFLPKNANASGLLTGVINITGKTNNPKAELSAELMNASYNGISLDAVYALASMENQVITVQTLMGQKGQYKAKMSGKLPLAAIYTSGYLAPTDNKGMDLTVDLSESDLAVIPLMTSFATKGEGPLDGKVHITGSLDEPQAYGTISIRNGLLHFKDVDKDLSSINTDLIFNGNSAVLQGDAQMGSGSAGYSGQVTWTGRKLASYEGALQLDKFDVQNEYARGPISGELYATEIEGTPTLTGHIDLENDKFKIPLSMEEGGELLPLKLDVTVNAGKNVRLYDRTLYDMLISGSVRFAGTTNRPNPSGQFNVESGTFKYLSHTFRINKGIAQFRQGSYLPTLDLQADTSVGEYNINLGVKGTIDSLDMTLRSNSNLPENQIISLLTFGRSGNDRSSALTGDDVTAVGVSAAQMYAFGYVEDAMKNTLGLDLINITTGSLDPNEPMNRETAGYYNVEIGKYLLPGLMATYSQGLNNQDRMYGVRYKLGSHISARGWHTSKGRSFIGSYWKTTF